jgi:hypothetical protein
MACEYRDPVYIASWFVPLPDFRTSFCRNDLSVRKYVTGSENFHTILLTAGSFRVNLTILNVRFMFVYILL